MEKHRENETLLRHRSKTDKSLEVERGKTDEILDQKSKNVENEISEQIHSVRVSADKVLESKRAEADLDATERRGDLNESETAHLDDKSLELERARSDVARQLERQAEDRVRRTERFQKRLIAESHLDSERQETDSNLLDERENMDFVSERHSELLSEEALSHDVTKTALVTRDQFLAVVSHDLRNPLSSISLSSALMRKTLSKGFVDETTLLRYLERIELSAANMDRMIGELLDVERMGNGKLLLKREKNDISALLSECKDIFAPVIASRSFSLTIETGPEPLFADIDHDRVLQVLSNLIGNAVKFTGADGEIKVCAQKKPTGIEISVIDNGPGIPEEKMSHIFERFSQLHSNDRRGLGLGLFISKWIVEAHKGHIWVTSEVGKGSTFSFSLPAIPVI